MSNSYIGDDNLVHNDCCRNALHRREKEEQKKRQDEQKAAESRAAERKQRTLVAAAVVKAFESTLDRQCTIKNDTVRAMMLVDKLSLTIDCIVGVASVVVPLLDIEPSMAENITGQAARLRQELVFLQSFIEQSDSLKREKTK